MDARFKCNEKFEILIFRKCSEEQIVLLKHVACNVCHYFVDSSGGGLRFFLEEAHTCMHADASNETPHFLYILFDIYIYIYIYIIYIYIVQIYIDIYLILKSGARHVWECGKVPWAS